MDDVDDTNLDAVHLARHVDHAELPAAEDVSRVDDAYLPAIKILHPVVDADLEALHVPVESPRKPDRRYDVQRQRRVGPHALRRRVLALDAQRGLSAKRGGRQCDDCNKHHELLHCGFSLFGLVKSLHHLDVRRRLQHLDPLLVLGERELFANVPLDVFVGLGEAARGERALGILAQQEAPSIQVDPVAESSDRHVGELAAHLLAEDILGHDILPDAAGRRVRIGGILAGDVAERLGLQEPGHFVALVVVLRLEEDHRHGGSAAGHVALGVLRELFAHRGGRGDDVLVDGLPAHRGDDHVVEHPLAPLGIRHLLLGESLHQLVAVAVEGALDYLADTVLDDPFLHGHLRLGGGLEDELALDHLVQHLGIAVWREAGAAHLEDDVALEDYGLVDLGGDAVNLDRAARAGRERGAK